MEKAPSFVVPAGVVFEIRDDGVTIENRGDIVLHTTFGRTLRRVVSAEGSIELHGDTVADVVRAHGGVKVHGALTASGVDAGGDLSVTGDASITAVRVGGGVAVHGNGAIRTVHAGGAVQVRGNLVADVVDSSGTVGIGGSFSSGVLRGAEVVLGDGAVSARGIQASHRVQIGAGKLQVDAIIAPQVDIATHASGRVTIIECQNELGPNALKGKLRLADYQETFGDPAAYLAERGLTVPGEPSAVVVVEAPRALEAVAAPVVEEAAAVEEPAEEAAVEEAAVEAHAAEEAPAEEAAEAAPAEASEAVTMDVEIEESEDAAMGSSVPAALPAAHPLHGDLVVAVAKIVDCYADAEVPPAVSHLQGLISAHAYEQVRAEITTIWTDLLKFHHKKGLRIQHQVTTTFNTINSLVKKM